MTSTAIVQQQMAQGNGNAASDAAVAAAAAAAAAAASAGGNTSHTSLLQHMTGTTFRGQVDNGGGQPEVNVDHQDHVHGKDFFFTVYHKKSKHHSIPIL